MSDTVVLKAAMRPQSGSKAAAQLRQQGQLPAVVYGHKKEPVSITLGAHDFVEALHHGHRIFEVDIDGSKDTLLVKDLQYDHLGKSVIHADLVRVNLSERVKVEVAIELRGTAQGTHEGGIVEDVLSHVEIECKVSDIPESLAVSIKELGLGQALHASQIELPADMTLMTDPEAVVAVCHEPRVVVVEEVPEGEEALAEGAAAEPTEPEVITEKKEDQEASE
jgi:large subunit ribosomal protein L25